MFSIQLYSRSENCDFELHPLMADLLFLSVHALSPLFPRLKTEQAIQVLNWLQQMRFLLLRWKYDITYCQRNKILIWRQIQTVVTHF